MASPRCPCATCPIQTLLLKTTPTPEPENWKARGLGREAPGGDSPQAPASSRGSHGWAGPASGLRFPSLKGQRCLTFLPPK